MAAFSQRQPVATLTPPASSHGGRGAWGYTVPIDTENTAPADQRSLYSVATAPNQPIKLHPRQALINQLSAGGSRPPTRGGDAESPQSLVQDEQAAPKDYLNTERSNPGLRKQSEISTTRSEADSLLELYKGNGSQPTPQAVPVNHNAASAPSDSTGTTLHTQGQNYSRKMSNVGQKRSNNHMRNQAQKKQTPQTAVEDDYWIHRDKLAEIESRELEQAGFTVPRVSRSTSKLRKESEQDVENVEPHADEEVEYPQHDGNGYYDVHEDKRQRLDSPTGAEEPVYDQREEPHNWDLRMPAETATEQRHEDQHQQHVLRPSTSKIPLAKISPAPVPNTYVERDSPAPRSRTSSGAYALNGEGIAFKGHHRARSGSVGSQVLLDDFPNGGGVRTPSRPGTAEAASPQGSPAKAKSPTKAAPVSGARNVSGARVASTARSRDTSVQRNVSSPRPGTSSGLKRPTTARPEGEAPWIATMFKPDPRLPPDQQMLPTHAKRMAQEQWEKEGKPSQMYDRDFRPLSGEFVKPPEQKTTELDVPEKDQSGQWPLPSPSTSNGRPGTSGTEHGGYKITPTIQSPQIPPQSPGIRPNGTSPVAASPKPVEPIRMQEPREDEKKKGGCGCCIVM